MECIVGLIVLGTILLIIGGNNPAGNNASTTGISSYNSTKSNPLMPHMYRRQIKRYFKRRWERRIMNELLTKILEQEGAIVWHNKAFLMHKDNNYIIKLRIGETAIELCRGKDLTNMLEIFDEFIDTSTTNP